MTIKQIIAICKLHSVQCSAMITESVVRIFFYKGTRTEIVSFNSDDEITLEQIKEALERFK